MSSSSVQALLKEASDITEKDPRSKGEAMEAVARKIVPLGDSALPELLEARTNSNILISQTAEIALSRMNTQGAFEAISPLLKESDGSTGQVFALNWMQKNPRPESVSLLEELFNSNPHMSVVKKITFVLRQMNYPQAKSLLEIVLRAKG